MTQGHQIPQVWLLELERLAEISARPDDLQVDLPVLGQAPLAGGDQAVQGVAASITSPRALRAVGRAAEGRDDLPITRARKTCQLSARSGETRPERPLLKRPGTTPQPG